MGYVYLIHLERPIGQPQSEEARAIYGLPPRKRGDYRPTAQHYIGYAKTSLTARLAQHLAGAGSRFMSAANNQGVQWREVRHWKGDRTLERELKSRHNARVLCPVCNPTGWKNQAKGKTK